MFLLLAFTPSKYLPRYLPALDKKKSKMSESNQKFKIYLLCFLLIPETVLDNTLSPLYPFIARHLLPNNPHVGYYAGLLQSTFYFPLLIMNILWGLASDKFGRKPILIIGIIAMTTFSLILSVSESYSLTLICRFAMGVFGSNSTITKSFIGDISKDQRIRSWGYAMYGSVFGICGILGPLLGGVLAHPEVLYPTLFAKDGFFGRNPFFLICAVSSSLGLVALYGAIFYLEDVCNEEEVELKLDDSLSDTRTLLSNQTDDEITVSPTVLTIKREFKLLSWKTMGPIFLYCILAFTEMTYATLIPLFFSSKAGFGLGFNSQKTSLIIVIASISNLLVSITNLVDVFLVGVGGSLNAFSLAMAGFIPCLLLLPPNAYLTGYSQGTLIFLLLSLMGMFEATAYQSIILSITDSQNSDNLGKTHGIATSMAALSRTVAPTMAGTVWDWSIKLGWDWYAFGGAGGAALMGAIASSGKLI